MDLFFVISGFVLYLNYHNQAAPPSNRNSSPRLYMICTLYLLVETTDINIPYRNPWGSIFYGILAFALITAASLWERSITGTVKPTEERTAQEKSGAHKNFSARPICIRLGNASYAMYLFGPLISDHIRGATWATYLLDILLMIGISVLINMFVEERALRIIGRALLKKG